VRTEGGILPIAIMQHQLMPASVRGQNCDKLKRKVKTATPKRRQTKMATWQQRSKPKQRQTHFEQQLYSPDIWYSKQ